MRILFNLIRTAIYLVVVYFFAFGVLVAFSYLAGKAYNFALGFAHSFWFWFLLFFIGITIMSILWYIFKMITGFIMAFIAWLCPYRSFAVWSAGLISSGISLFYLIGYWFIGGIINFVSGVIGVMLTIGCIQLCILLVKATMIGYESLDEVKQPI